MQTTAGPFLKYCADKTALTCTLERRTDDRFA